MSSSPAVQIELPKHEKKNAMRMKGLFTFTFFFFVFMVHFKIKHINQKRANKIAC